jgi:hypothetical protein
LRTNIRTRFPGADRVTDLHPDDRAGHRAAERPDGLGEPRGDRHLLLRDDEIDVVDVARQSGRCAGVSRGIGGSVRIGRDLSCGKRTAVVVTARCLPSDHDRALHAGRGMARDRAEERHPSRRDVDHDADLLARPGVSERAVGEGDVVRHEACVRQADLVPAGSVDRQLGWGEAQVERLDLQRSQRGCR